MKTSILLAATLFGAGSVFAKEGHTHSGHADHGVRFSCRPHEVPQVRAAMSGYLRCYTATKLVMVKGVLDYYGRARDLPGMSSWMQSRLLSDGEPLVDVEPGIAWSFEPDFDPKEASKPGKIATIVHNVAPRNFVPGDWVYLLNTDPISRQKTGHEGSNAIYLGGGRFVDYYADNNHAFTYVEKLDEVFQWRHGVFDLRRDAALRQPLTAADRDRLSLPPEKGGFVHSWRITPAFFGAEMRIPERRTMQAGNRTE